MSETVGHTPDDLPPDLPSVLSGDARERAPSFILTLDPRVRLAAAVACSVVFAVLAEAQSAAIALGFAALCLVASRPPWRSTLRRVAAINAFFILLWLTAPFTTPGDAAFALGPLEATRQGLELCLLVTLKANAIALMFLALAGGMNPAELGGALERLHCPAKLVFLLIFAYRYAHVAAREWRTLAVSARLRGFAPRASLHTYATYAQMIGMVLVNSFERSERVYEAMLLRGFTGRFRTVADYRARRRDAVFLLALGVCLACLLALPAFLPFLPGK